MESYTKRKKVLAGTSLPVMEHFITLQGEGYHAGRAAYFVRLGGCDVGCTWCDVKESWDASAHPTVNVYDLAGQMAMDKPRLAVITGGEPLMHPLDPLTQALKGFGFKVHLETSGAYPLSGEFDWICVSPKKFRPPLPEVLAVANELKVIVYNRNDFEWAEKYAAQVPNTCKLYLQPEWSKVTTITPQIANYLYANPKWQLGLQTHKYINMP